MMVSVERIDPFTRLGELFEIYCDALGGNPQDRQWPDEVLPRHASRDDFVFLVALEDGRILGFAYGYRGDYGQWWTDRVAEAMDAETRHEWLDPPHFEVVELHVRPERQRGGVGTRLLDELLARQPHGRAVLTADPAKPQPLPFYAKHGWQRLAEVRWSPTSSPRIVLGKAL